MSGELLTWAPNVETERPLDKFVLLVLECGAVGAADLKTYADIRKVVGCSERSLRQAMNRLEAAGQIVFASRVPALIQFGPYELALDRAMGSMTDDPWQVLRAKVFAQKRSQCAYCGRNASHVDHVLPRSRGGADTLDNLVPACARCNIEKGNKTVEEWRGGR